jgi:prepilin peptidase CpaA
VAEFVTVPVVVVFIAVLTMAATDLWKFKIHNAFTLPLLFTGLIYQGVANGAPGLLDGVRGALFGFGVLFLFYVLGGMGSGDVKLLAAVGAWLGLPLTFYVFIASSLAAGVYSVVLLLTYRRLGESWANLQVAWYRMKAIGRYLGNDDAVEVEANRADRRQRLIPFAAMVAVGLVVALLAAFFLTRPS